MRTFNFSPEFITRYSAFLASNVFEDIPEYSKSEYWKTHSRLINVNVSGNEISVSGSSGYYIPPLRDPGLRAAQKMKRLIQDPSLLLSFLKRKQQQLIPSRIKLLDHFQAFEAVMQNDPIADLDPGVERVDFKRMATNFRTVHSIQDMDAKFFARAKYSLNALIVYSYYVWNLLCDNLPVDRIRTVLEIGPGNGNLSSLLHHQLNSRIICVDLPETLCLSIAFIADMFPDAKILMPHEVPATGNYEGYDFIFLTPGQASWIKDNSVDLVINTSSFQEMTRQQISEYFKCIQRVTAPGAYFFSLNRVEKLLINSAAESTTEPPSRFSHYPWDLKNDIIFYQICPLHRLVQLEDVFIRLEKVNKT